MVELSGGGMIKLYTVGLSLVLSLAAMAAHSESWRTYHNGKYGASARYPANWKVGPLSPLGDGRSFTSPDGRAIITIAGLPGGPEDLGIYAQAQANQVVIYRNINSKRVILSGTQGSNVFYQKSLLTCSGTIWVQVFLQYPQSEKAKYDPIVTHVAASLHGGGLTEFSACKQ